MKLLDTSVLIEFFSGDEERIEKIDDLFRELEKQKEKLLITEEVVIELAYYLELVYGWEREVVVEVLETILTDSLFSVEDRDILYEALKVYSNTKAQFIDALKVAKAKRRKVNEVVSLTKRFEKLGMKVIKP